MRKWIFVASGGGAGGTPEAPEEETEKRKITEQKYKTRKEPMMDVKVCEYDYERLG